jgi:mycofactocin precursor
MSVETVVNEAESATSAAAPAEPVEVVTDDLLVEEVSIDGMCGVY